MMKIQMKMLAVVTAFFCALATVEYSSAGTILKLSLGNDSTADLSHSGGIAGVLSTVDDLNGATTGDQNTAIEFLGQFSSMTNIPAADASYSLSGVTAFGPATVVGSLVIQDYIGGTFHLYDDTDTLLLGVALGGSTLAGPLGPPATGAVFSTTFGTPLPGPLGGTLASLIVPGTVTMSIGLADINGGSGLSVSGPGPFLDAFLADATKTIAAEVIPEPAAATLLLFGSVMFGVIRRRRA